MAVLQGLVQSCQFNSKQILSIVAYFLLRLLLAWHLEKIRVTSFMTKVNLGLIYCSA